MKAKFYIDQEIRRLSIEESTTFEELLKIIYDFWLSQNPNDQETLSDLNFRYLDSDEDWVLFSTSEEWKDALSNVKEVLKIKIEKKENVKPKQESNKPQQQKEEESQKPKQFQFPQFPNFSQQTKEGNQFDFLKNMMTPENMQMAQNMFSQFTQGQNPNDFMKMFQQQEQQEQGNNFPFFQQQEQPKKTVSNEEIKILNDQLISMGFYDSSMNENLLKKYEGNVEKVVNHLISQ